MGKLKQAQVTRHYATRQAQGPFAPEDSSFHLLLPTKTED